MADRVAPDDALRRTQQAVGTRARSVALNFDQVDIVCDTEQYVALMTTLRDDPQLRCRFFTFLSAIDFSEFGDNPGGLELLVHVSSPDFALQVVVHVPLDLDDPRCPTLTDVYKGALWHEREMHEMFGIDFEGHPHLVNLYLPEDFEGHPLRKSFKLPGRQIKEWPGAKDPEEAAAGGR